MIEDVIVSECIRIHKLELTPRNNEKYYAFVKRQMAKMPEDTKPYRDLLIDKLLLFAYLLGERPVCESVMKPPVRVRTKAQLKLLRSRGNDTVSWDDAKLAQINSRRNYGMKWYKLPSYVQLIDEIGKEPEIVKRWRGIVSYDADVSLRGRKNPYVGTTKTA